MLELFFSHVQLNGGNVWFIELFVSQTTLASYRLLRQLVSNDEINATTINIETVC